MTRAITRILLLLWALAYMVLAAPMRLGWDPSLHASSYEVWRGIDRLAVVQSPEALLDLPADQISTITVRAVNSAGTSPHSAPITVIPITAQYSADLAAWDSAGVFFVERTDRQFFRISHPHPTP